MLCMECIYHTSGAQFIRAACNRNQVYLWAIVEMGTSSPFNATGGADQPSTIDKLNTYVLRSKVGRIFELRSRKTTFTRELCAAFTVFLTVAQIIAVNPAILSASGGPCTVEDCTGPLKGTTSCRNPQLDTGYAECLAAVSKSLVATTCLSAAIGCFMMAFLANMPLVLAPGMGVNAFFTFTMVGQYGTGALTYAQGMAVVMAVALLVLLISVLGLRGRVMQLFPSHLIFAMVVGLGLFLALTGLRSHSGIGLVVGHPTTLLTAGGCPEQNQAHALILPPGVQAQHMDSVDPQLLNMLQVSDAYGCQGGIMLSAQTWLGIAAALLMVLLMASKVKAAIAWGVLFATVIAWIPGHHASYFSGPPGSPGALRFEEFKQVVSLPNPSKTSLHFDFTAFQKSEAWAALFGMFYVVFLDATGTAFALAEMIHQQLPGFMGPAFSFPRRMGTLVADGLACIPGALMGTSPLIVTVESSVGIEEGGRTGLVALAAGCMFLIAMFFAPLFSQIPPYATGPALIVVGSLMTSNARFIDWQDINESFPSFVTIALMPLTYSISNGLLAGIAATFALWVLETLTDIGKAVYAKDPDNTPGDVLHGKFHTWRTAFGDLTWSGYKTEVQQIFQRSTGSVLQKVLSRRLSSRHTTGGSFRSSNVSPQQGEPGAVCSKHASRDLAHDAAAVIPEEQELAAAPDDSEPGHVNPRMETKPEALQHVAAVAGKDVEQGLV